MNFMVLEMTAAKPGTNWMFCSSSPKRIVFPEQRGGASLSLARGLRREALGQVVRGPLVVVPPDPHHISAMGGPSNTSGLAARDRCVVCFSQEG